MDDSLAEEFDMFYRAEYGRLAGALRLACGGDGQLGEELAQEAMIRAWARWSRVRSMERPAGWLYATGFNLVRRRWQLTRRPRDEGSTVADDVAAAESRLVLEAALRALPLRQRKAVVARHVLGLSTDEAAALLAMPPDALRALLHRGVTALRRSPALAAAEE
jgi:RNA polymerase sigma-70 factor (ECF subfamily)